jgi:hypothetical protein
MILVVILGAVVLAVLKMAPGRTPEGPGLNVITLKSAKNRSMIPEANLKTLLKMKRVATPAVIPEATLALASVVNPAMIPMAALGVIFGVNLEMIHGKTLAIKRGVISTKMPNRPLST